MPDHELTADNLPVVLRQLGLVDDDEVRVTPLAGGVSCAVYRVDWPGRSVIVKQALPKLRVTEEWLSDPERSRVEVLAMRYLSKVLPGHVPELLAEDDRRHLFVMEAAPVGSVTWKEEMLAGIFDLEAAATAGGMLGVIHETGRDDPAVASQFADKRFFRQLRIDAYLGEIARVHPEVSPIAEDWMNRLLERADTFVHGDYSPKNLLLTPERRMLLLDHEVAHRGDPVFDLAFFFTHLAAKSLRHPEAGRAFATALAAYRASAPLTWQGVGGMVPQLLGLVMLARVDGKSPLEYLDEPERNRLRTIAIDIALHPPESLDQVAAGLPLGTT